MPRILMTADAIGGVWSYALELARALAASDLSTTLAVMGPAPTDAQLAEARSVPRLDVHCRSYRLEWMPEAWDDVERAGTWLLDIESRVRPDVVHLNGYAHGALPFRAPVVIVAHSCVRSWNDAVGGTFDPRWLERYREEVARGLVAADVVVAPSAAMLTALRRHYGALPHTAVIPNGRSAQLFRPARKEQFVFAAGRLWDRAKNIDALARVAPRLTWPVVIAGESDSGHAMPGHAADFPDNVHYLGPLTPQDMVLWLSRASIVVQPARYEPFGLLALEAALAGCALVVGDIPSQREIWGDAAIFVNPERDRALEEAIAGLMADSNRLRRAAERARTRALDYSPERMASRYLTVYQRARREHRRRTRRVPLQPDHSRGVQLQPDLPARRCSCGS